MDFNSLAGEADSSSGALGSHHPVVCSLLIDPVHVAARVVSFIVHGCKIVEAPFSDAGVGAPVCITFRFALGFEDSVVAEVVGVLPLAGLSVPLRIDMVWISSTIFGASVSILEMTALGPAAQVIKNPVQIIAAYAV